MNTIRRTEHALGRARFLTGVLLLVFCFCSGSPAHGAPWEKAVCPACGEDFVQFNAPCRGAGDGIPEVVGIDGEGGPIVAGLDRLETCPSCLYTRPVSDLEPLPENERAQVLVLLAELPNSLPPIPQRLAKLPSEYLEEYTRWRIATACVYGRHASLSDRARIDCGTYLAVKRLGDRELVRKQARVAARSIGEMIAESPIYAVDWAPVKTGLEAVAAGAEIALAKPYWVVPRSSENQLLEWIQQRASAATVPGPNAAVPSGRGFRFHQTHVIPRDEVRRLIPVFVAALREDETGRDYHNPSLLPGRFSERDISGIEILAREGDWGASAFLLAWLSPVKNEAIEEHYQVVGDAAVAMARSPDLFPPNLVSKCAFSSSSIKQALRYSLGEISFAAAAPWVTNGVANWGEAWVSTALAVDRGDEPARKSVIEAIERTLRGASSDQVLGGFWPLRDIWEMAARPTDCQFVLDITKYARRNGQRFLAEIVETSVRNVRLRELSRIEPLER